MHTRLSGLRADKPALVAVFIFVLGTILDSVTTHFIIVNPNVRELNPVVRETIAYTGLPGFILLKLALFLAFMGVVYLVYPRRHHRRAVIIAATTVGLIWTGAGVWNAHHLF